MKRAERHIIKPSHPFYEEVDRLCFASKNLYNTVMYTTRHSFFYGYGVPSWGQLNGYFKDTPQYKALPAKVSQLVIKQVSEAWDSYFKTLKQYQENPAQFTGKPQIPGYKDTEGRNLVKYNKQAYYRKLLNQEGIVRPSMTEIMIPVKALDAKTLDEIRLVPKYGYYVIEIVYEVPDVETASNDEVVAAMDLGVDNLATVVFNHPQLAPFIINGKPLKSANQWWNKRKSWLQSLLSEGQHTSKQIEAITIKRNCYVDNYLHHASKVIVEQCLQAGVTKVVIGKNAHWKREVNLGRVNNQKFVQIPYNKFIDLLQYKLSAEAIEVVVAEESYTSKSSFLDWDNIPTYDPQTIDKPSFSGKRIKRAWYKSQSGTLIHADVNAAYNIGRKVVPTAFSSLKEIVARDRGCLVVQPRRITPVSRVKCSARELLKPQVVRQTT